MSTDLEKQSIPKITLIIIAAIVGVTLIGAVIIPGLWNLGVKFDHWQRAKEPLICVKSHDVSSYGYGYGMTMSGKMGYGMVWMTETICNKQAPNPYYQKK